MRWTRFVVIAANGIFCGHFTGHAVKHNDPQLGLYAALAMGLMFLWIITSEERK